MFVSLVLAQSINREMSGNGMSILWLVPYLLHTFNSVTGSGNAKYQENPLACKLHGNSALKIYLHLICSGIAENDEVVAVEDFLDVGNYPG